MAKMSKMMKQAQRLQSQMAKAQEEIKQLEKTFSVGGGAVEAVARGDGSLAAVRIKPDVIREGEAEELEDLILTAVNGALEEVRSEAEEKMSGLTAGLNLPPGLF